MLHGEAKAAAVRALAEREGLDLARCSAYSDSINDLPMLSLVGYPVAVNPDSALRDEAKQRGWEIRDFRTGRKAADRRTAAARRSARSAGGVAAGLAMRRVRRQRAAATRGRTGPAAARDRHARPIDRLR